VVKPIIQLSEVLLLERLAASYWRGGAPLDSEVLEIVVRDSLPQYLDHSVHAGQICNPGNLQATLYPQQRKWRIYVI
jgi:hypothetical protein